MLSSNPTYLRSGGVQAALALVCLARAALIAFLMLASIFASAAHAAASDTNYRLAGIIGDGSERSIAVIELADGRQRLVRTGDMLGEGRIVEITRVGVRIEFAGEDLTLRMRGNPRFAAASPRVEAASAADEGDAQAAADGGDPEAEADGESAASEGGVRNQQLSLADAAGILDAAQTAGAQAGGEVASADTVGGRLNALLEIPSEATITEVDGAGVDTPEAALAAIQSSLRQGHSARLTVRDAGDLTTVLLAADAEQ